MSISCHHVGWDPFPGIAARASCAVPCFWYQPRTYLTRGYVNVVTIISKCYWHSSDQTAPRSGASDSELKFGSVMSCVTGSGVSQASSAAREISFGEVLAGKALGEMLRFW